MLKSRSSRSVRASEPEPTAAPEEVTSPAGITAGGRAITDPREAPRPVGVVEITTTHPALFTGNVAPDASHSGRVAPRAVNDPRGPLAMPEQEQQPQAAEG